LRDSCRLNGSWNPLQEHEQRNQTKVVRMLTGEGAELLCGVCVGTDAPRVRQIALFCDATRGLSSFRLS
jgi:hypothetical protein